MKMPPHCTVSVRRRVFTACELLPLTLGVLALHGFHPWAEDGGLYVAGVEHLLHPKLFPMDRAFVTAPCQFSVFAPTLALLVRCTHSSLPSVLLGLYLASTMLMLFAGRRIARLCFPAQLAAQATAVSLLAAWWTLPVAGTSLLLMDPYLTARSVSSPLTLLAIGDALQWHPYRPGARSRSYPDTTSFRAPVLLAPLTPLARCVLWLALAAAFHPLMAIPAIALTLVLLLLWRGVPVRVYCGLTALIFLAGTLLQAWARPATPSARAAVASRYYWFLSQWQGYEWLGLVGPLLVFGLLLRSLRESTQTLPRTAYPNPNPNPNLDVDPDPAPRSAPAVRVLCLGCILLGLLATSLSLVFAREHYAAFAVARLQPLRAFQPIYACLPLLLGGFLASRVERTVRRRYPVQGRKIAAACLSTALIAMALLMFFVQRASFPSSPHIEWPNSEWPNLPNTNPWAEAFVWIRQNTPAEDVFALDARYINTPGEDAQGFRAIAERSALPDYSKDGGEAANFPQLAPLWLRASNATAGLSRLSDAQRKTRLAGFSVQWLVLQAASVTSLPCPYENRVVKVCRLRP